MVSDAKFSVQSSKEAYARLSRRVYGLLIDSVVHIAMFALVVLLVMMFQDNTGIRVSIFGLFLVFLLLYEPLFVTLAGGTIGHRLMNLRVVAEGTGGNVTFPRALARMLIKWLLGLFTFVFMVVTRRNQALHDLATRSTVQIRDIGKASPWHYVHARQIEPAGSLPSRSRRVAGIVVYNLAVAIGVSIISTWLIAERCITEDKCSEMDNAVLTVLGLSWMGCVALILVLGWKGRLPGFWNRPTSMTEK